MRTEAQANPPIRPAVSVRDIQDSRAGETSRSCLIDFIILDMPRVIWVCILESGQRSIVRGIVDGQ